MERSARYLPGLDKYTGSRPKQDHPACLLVIIDEIEQDDKLNNNVGDNLDFQAGSTTLCMRFYR